MRVEGINGHTSHLRPAVPFQVGDYVRAKTAVSGAEREGWVRGIALNGRFLIESEHGTCYWCRMGDATLVDDPPEYRGPPAA